MSRMVAILIERATRAHDHIWAWRPAPCWHCGKPTHWVEVNFEARLHRGHMARLPHHPQRRPFRGCIVPLGR